MVKTSNPLDDAYRAVQALRPVVDEMTSLDAEQERVEALLAQFATVVWRKRPSRQGAALRGTTGSRTR